MEESLREARAAGARGEVPIGAVVVRDGLLLARAGNASIAEADPTGHAEVRALRSAASVAGNYRLPRAVLYVTVEPCVMCMGAALQARIARRLNHRMVVDAGLAEDEGRAVVQGFFRARRARAR